MNGVRDALDFVPAELAIGVLVPLARITVVLLAVWIIHGLLAGANPRWRILVWRSAAMSLVVISAFAFAGPLVTLPVLPAEPATATTEPAETGSAAPSEFTSTTPLAESGRSPSVPSPHVKAPILAPANPEPATAVSAIRNEPATTSSAGFRQRAFLFGAVLAVWLVGVVIGLFRTFIGFVQLKKVCRTAGEVPSWIEEELAGLRQQFRLSSSVVARQTDAVTTPCSVGFVRGTILLPAALCEETRREELRAALLHEAAHFRGGDLQWNHLLHTITIVLWFHPLTWRIRLAHADACDERCDAEAAEYLGSTESYSRSLARIALSAKGRIAPAAMTMARRQGVSRRIDVLRRGVGWCDLERRSIATVWGVTAFFILAVAGIGLGPSAAGDTDLNDATTSDEATSHPANDSDKSPKETNDEPGANWDLDLTTPKTITGRVVDRDGKPVAAARLWWVVAHGRPEVIVTGTTDEQGRFSLSTSATEIPEAVRRHHIIDTLWVYEEGLQMAAARAGGIIHLPEQPRELLIRLEPTTDTSFVVTAPDATPVAGALVEPFHFRTYQGYDDIIPEELRALLGGTSDVEGRVRMPEMPREGFHSARAITDRFGTQELPLISAGNPSAERTISLQPTGRIEGRLVSDDPILTRGVRLYFSSLEYRYPPVANGVAEVTTDDQGRFVVDAMTEGRMAIDVVSDTDAPALPRLPERTTVRAGEATTLEIPLEPTVLVRGTIRTRDTDQPVPGAEIFVGYGVGRQGAMVLSDADGRYQARVLAGQVGTQVIVRPDAFMSYEQLGDSWDEKTDVPPGAEPFELPPIRLEPTASLKGKLIDQKGRPVANVMLWGGKGNRRYAFTKTDKEGAFSTRVPVSIELESWQVSFDDDSYLVDAEVFDDDPLTLRVDRPGADTEPATDPAKDADGAVEEAKDDAATGAADEPVRTEFSIIIAGQVLLLDGKSITTWEEIEQKIAGLDNPSLAYPHFYITGGARQAGKTEAAKKKIWELHGKYKLKGHSEGSLSQRADWRYDRIRSEADFRPDDALKKNRTVVFDGKPVAGVEVVLITPIDPAISYQTYDLALVGGRIRNRLEHVMAVSDEAGNFTLYPPHYTSYYVLALHPDRGFAVIREEQFKNEGEIKLQPWAGIVIGLDDPKKEQSLNISTRIPENDERPEIGLRRPEIVINQYWDDLKKSDKTGEFHYSHIPAFYQTTLSRSMPYEKGASISIPEATISFLAGETRHLHLGEVTEQQLEQVESTIERTRPNPEPETPDE